MFLLLFAVAAQTPSMKADCRNTAATQLEHNECSRQRYAEADRELNIRWRNISTKAREFNQLTFQRLLNGQRAWLRYRDETCGWVKDTYKGTMTPMIYFDCMEAVTRKHTEQLAMMAAASEF